MTMNYHNDDRCPDRDAFVATIDTDDETIREAVDVAAPGEAIPIDIAFRGVTFERIDLERGDGEPFGEWIREAVAVGLEAVGDVEPGGDDDLPGRPADYTPENDTPDDEILSRVAGAYERGEWIGVTVEFPARTLERLLARPGDTVAEWVRTAVRIRFQQINRKFEVKPKVTVDLPPEVAERAQLDALHKAGGDPDEDYHDTLLEILLNLVQPQTEYRVGGDVIASFDDEADVVDFATD